MADLHRDHRTTVLRTLEKHVGSCREWVDDDQCNAPAEFVLWGCLIPNEGLGPRCYDHAVKHVAHHALGSRSNFALINLRDLAADLEAL